jgi:hypothetical protein
MMKNVRGADTPVNTTQKKIQSAMSSVNTLASAAMAQWRGKKGATMATLQIRTGVHDLVKLNLAEMVWCRRAWVSCVITAKHVAKIPRPAVAPMAIVAPVCQSAIHPA